LLSSQQIVELVKEGKKSKPRKFTESIEAIITLKDIDLKKTDLNINEIVYMPHPTGKVSKICFIGSGDLALRAKNAKVDAVIDPSQLENYSGNKKDAKKLARSYDFFLADTSLMPRIGKILGQFLGPKGKIPIPVPPQAPVEAMIQRLRNAVRVRSRGSLGISVRVGTKELDDKQLAENIQAFIQTVVKKLPNGERNIKSIIVKTTMGKPVKRLVEQE
jgi:large subunit ribosomal protein L1